jgi:hypothetical protein
MEVGKYTILSESWDKNGLTALIAKLAELNLGIMSFPRKCVI